MRKVIAAVMMVLATLSVTACDGGTWGCEAGTHEESHVDYTYHYGYNYMTNKYEFFFGPETVSECVADR